MMSLGSIEPRWDAVVVGAGVGGATLAALLARRGWKTLLVDRARFPRQKVCGCCLSAATLGLLERLRLGECAAEGVPLREARLLVRGREHAFPHGGAALSRAALDGRLAELAQRQGATFLCGTGASDEGIVGPARQVRLRAGEFSRSVRATAIFVADGIGGRFAESVPALQWRVARGARLGVAAIVPAGAVECPAGSILLAVGRGGYIGVVGLEDGEINIAAAVAPDIARERGGPGLLVDDLLTESGIRHDLSGATWHGTPLLTRRRQVLGSQRLLMVGDACAYEEPFSGEGMKWAILSAAALATLLPAPGGWDDALPLTWTRRHRRLFDTSLARCRGVSRLLRHPRLLSAALRLFRPSADGIVREISRLPPEDAYCPQGVSA